MQSHELAQRVFWRMYSAQMAKLSDDQLQAIIDAPMSDSDRAEALRVSAGRTDDIRQLTDAELMRLIEHPME